MTCNTFDYSPLNLYLVILWILDFKYILLLLLLGYGRTVSFINKLYYTNPQRISLNNEYEVKENNLMNSDFWNMYAV